MNLRFLFSSSLNVFCRVLRVYAATAREETSSDTLDMTKAFLSESLNAGGDAQGSGGEGEGSASTSSSW